VKAKTQDERRAGHNGATGRLPGRRHSTDPPRRHDKVTGRALWRGRQAAALSARSSAALTPTPDPADRHGKAARCRVKAAVTSTIHPDRRQVRRPRRGSFNFKWVSDNVLASDKVLYG
jgi:hypothetical protein